MITPKDTRDIQPRGLMYPLWGPLSFVLVLPKVFKLFSFFLLKPPLLKKKSRVYEITKTKKKGYNGRKKIIKKIAKGIIFLKNN